MFKNLEFCVNELIANTERDIWIKTLIPYNTDAILNYIRIGCYDCKPNKECIYRTI